MEELVDVAVDYLEKPIYAEDGKTILKPAGLQIEKVKVEADPNTISFINKMNYNLYVAFKFEDQRRALAIDRLILSCNQYRGLKYYTWAFKYMTPEAVQLLKANMQEQLKHIKIENLPHQK